MSERARKGGRGREDVEKSERRVEEKNEGEKRRRRKREKEARERHKHVTRQSEKDQEKMRDGVIVGEKDGEIDGPTWPLFSLPSSASLSYLYLSIFSSLSLLIQLNAITFSPRNIPYTRAGTHQRQYQCIISTLMCRQHCNSAVYIS